MHVSLFSSSAEITFCLENIGVYVMFVHMMGCAIYIAVIPNSSEQFINLILALVILSCSA